MQNYCLIIEDFDAAEPQRIVFKAESPDYGLVVAKHRAPDRCAELWDGHRRLARISMAAPDLWHLHRCLASGQEQK